MESQQSCFCKKLKDPLGVPTPSLAGCATKAESEWFPVVSGGRGAWGVSYHAVGPSTRAVDAGNLRMPRPNPVVRLRWAPQRHLGGVGEQSWVLPLEGLCSAAAVQTVQKQIKPENCVMC